mgnify:CR=1 FL=1
MLFEEKIIAIIKNTIISNHFNLLINQPCVAAVKTKIAVKEVDTINNP